MVTIRRMRTGRLWTAIKRRRISPPALCPIQLLLTDIVMPGIRGCGLFVRGVSSQPDMRVLYMSGYTENAIGRDTVLEPGAALLHKPFTLGTLVQKVRDTLDSDTDGI